ncbi:MAG: HD domain-containing protein [Dehalococcoidia bacterium]|nr:HD domain-containing protein [Dehalococcoidia bacterium]
MYEVTTRLTDTCKLVEALIGTSPVKDLWQVRDGGMPVFVHTVDVTLLAIENISDWQLRYGSLDLAAVTLGSLLHDLTKATCRAHRQFTHSWVMCNQPDIAVKEAMDALDAVQLSTGLPIDFQLADHVSHIVASHHGQWGKVNPATPEAALVHWCDIYSSQHHRLTPVDANDVLPLLADGLTKTKAARFLGISVSTVNSRLSESCAVEGLCSFDDLVSLWTSRGWVRSGSPERIAQLRRARWLMEEAVNASQLISSALLALESVASGYNKS